ncbi:MAG: ABC transporter ATP-binding protein [Clostridium sp.]
MSQNLIEINNLVKLYHLNSDTYEVLKGLNFTVKKGSFVVVMGKSGSGKTTLLNIIGLLDGYDGGSYIFNGSDIDSIDENGKSYFRSSHIGFIFQQFHLIDSLNVEQNVELPMLYRGGYTKDERVKRIQKSLEQVGLSEKLKSYPNQLSGGQQQRVSIARALANEPDIILADEPTGALDSENAQQIMDLLLGLNKLGKTIIMVTHDEDFKKYATHFVYIRDGVFIREECI